ncbi:hypothetical protein [Flavobacterium sp. ZS1P14]|uniref:hypothetical protein n=1 Tax=Flavobacterium sp. ZS1P14 TaxID=3401729 RepID=UPI003AAEEE58
MIINSDSNLFDSLLSLFIIPGLQLPIALIKKDWTLILCFLSTLLQKKLLVEKIREVIWDCLLQKLKQTVNYKKINWSAPPFLKKGNKQTVKEKTKLFIP